MNREEEDLGEGRRVEIPSAKLARAQRAPYHSFHAHRSSVVDEMDLIPESREATFKDYSASPEPTASLMKEPESSRQVNSPSLLRRITTKLSSPITPTSPIIPSPIALTSFKSLRRSRTSDYENLQDADDEHERVPVDLSFLTGMGYELTEMEEVNPVRPKLEPLITQDTAYRPSSAASPKPNFQSFIKRRQVGEVGDGLKDVAQLKRNPSLPQQDTQVEELKQNRTHRDAAVQSLAEKRNMIVAVSNAVDLSFYEGPVVRTSTSQSFETMFNRSGTVSDMPQSYFFPPDPKGRDWRPRTMSTLFIAFLALGAFALAGCQEYLLQKSQGREANGRGLLEFDQVNTVSVGKFFTWKYLPTMVTIIYAVLFSVMDFDIRRLEPFYQLSQPHGSPASESLNVDLLTMFQYFVPFKAFRLRQWTVFFSTIGNIIASTASPALQNPSVNFTDNPKCELPPNSSQNDNSQCLNDPDLIKKYVVVISPIWSRLLSGSYFVVGAICLILLFQLRRKSGLLSDPKGIAGIASMATKSHILREFQGTDLYSLRELNQRLAHRRFVLYKSSIWQGQWSPEKELEQKKDNKLQSPHPPMLRMTAAIPFIIAQVFCLAAVPVISLTRANVVPNNFPWLPILIATILKLVWSTFEADVRLMEPFYQLSKGNAKPEASLTLDYQATIYGFMPFKAAYNGHWLLCTVGVCSVALDILSVTVSSFSIQANKFVQELRDYVDKNQSDGDDSDTSVGDETKISFWVSVVLSMTILVIVIITTVLVYHRRRHPFLPREPSTIASVLAFIYASKMLDDFIDTETLTNKEMEAKLKGIGKRYSLGWFTGRDNQIHCAIDEEPMRSKYEHGQHFSRAVTGPLDVPGPGGFRV